MGSTPSTVVLTAILERDPASLATDLISTTPEAISGTSISNRRRTMPGWVREIIICGPLVEFLTSTT